MQQQRVSESENQLAQMQISYEESSHHEVAEQESSGLLYSMEISSAAHPTQQASTLTDMVTASALGKLLDNAFTGRNSDVLQLQLTDCVPLGTYDSSKLKFKIWSNGFGNMKSLLPYSIEEPLSTIVNAGKIELQQSSSSKILITINQRTDDFLIQRRF